MKKIISYLSLFFIVLSPLSAQNTFLTLEEAFILEAKVVEDKAVVSFTLAEDIYVYKERVSVEIESNENIAMGAFVLPEGHEHDGDMVYYDAQVLEVPLTNISNGSGVAAFNLLVD